MMNIQAVAIRTALILLLAAGSLRAAEFGETLANLNAAYQGESNAQNRYTRFAQAAEAEGHADAARLFRAAAMAEGIHRGAHRTAIEALGGTVAEFELDPVVPGTTADNLRAAIEGESYERDTMYPNFLKQAMAVNARPAMRSIRFALDAEAQHAALYKAALENLGNDRTPAVDYYVCQTCGYTTTELPAKRCPTCRRPVEEEYVKVT